MGPHEVLALILSQECELFIDGVLRDPPLDKRCRHAFTYFRTIRPPSSNPIDNQLQLPHQADLVVGASTKPSGSEPAGGRSNGRAHSP
jgi:hypothetical protein